MYVCMYVCMYVDDQFEFRHFILSMYVCMYALLHAFLYAIFSCPKANECDLNSRGGGTPFEALRTSACESRPFLQTFFI